VKEIHRSSTGLLWVSAFRSLLEFTQLSKSAVGKVSISLSEREGSWT